MKLAYVTLVILALTGRTAYCQDDDGDMSGGYGDDAYGGGGGEDEAPPAETHGGEELQELYSLSDFEAFIDNADASVIAAFTAKEITDPKAVIPEGWDEEEDGEWEPETIEHPELSTFKKISTNVYGYRYAYTTEPEVLAKLKSKNGGLFLYRSPRFVSSEHGDRPRERYPSATLNEQAVANFLSAKAQPLVGQYSSTTKDRYKSSVLVIFMNLDWEKNKQGIQYVLKRARKVAVGLKGKLAFAVAHASDMSYDMSEFGLTSTKPNTEILMGIHSGSDYYSSPSDAFSAKALTEFADSYLAGELSPYVKPSSESDDFGDDADATDEETAEEDDAGSEESSEDSEAKDEM
mmetsp:Transcript_61375/g.102151  ORF Transcript_61375/g.102151 Transcript_61375/m.102151 type:complete len:349 (+) Transcript_61375:81-1127(+)